MTRESRLSVLHSKCDSLCGLLGISAALVATLVWKSATQQEGFKKSKTNRTGSDTLLDVTPFPH